MKERRLAPAVSLSLSEPARQTRQDREGEGKKIPTRKISSAEINFAARAALPQPAAASRSVSAARAETFADPDRVSAAAVGRKIDCCAPLPEPILKTS